MERKSRKVWASGSWLGKLFPDTIGKVITCTKQEVYYFGVPAQKSSMFDRLPVWVDVDGRDFYYGIPGNNNRGFKIGVDIRGKEFDPTDGDHVPTPETLRKRTDIYRSPLSRFEECTRRRKQGVSL
jgi:hypothetical protein